MTDGLTKTSSSHLGEIATMIMVEPDEARTFEDMGKLKIKYGSLQRFSVSHEFAEDRSPDLYSDEYFLESSYQ